MLKVSQQAETDELRISKSLKRVVSAGKAILTFVRNYLTAERYKSSNTANLANDILQ